MDEHRDVKFGVQVDHSKSQVTDDKLSLKGAFSCHKTHLNISVMAQARDFKFCHFKDVTFPRHFKGGAVFDALHQTVCYFQRSISNSGESILCRKG